MYYILDKYLINRYLRKYLYCFLKPLGVSFLGILFYCNEGKIVNDWKHQQQQLNQTISCKT